MRLHSVDVIPYALPFREPYVTSRGTLGRREMVLLRLRTEEGLVGLGEAVPLALRGGASLRRVVREMEALDESGLLPAQVEPGEDDGLRTGAAGAPLTALEGLSAPARCAVSTALLDLRGRAAANSRLLPQSGQRRELGRDRTGSARAIRCNATLVAGLPEAVAADARRWAADGFSTFKLKLGRGDDVGQVSAVREAVGPQARIRVDANAAWNVETAIRVIAELEPFDVELVEQPVATTKEMVRVATAVSVPIAGDESIASREEAERAASLGACEFTGIKLSKVGGAGEAIAIADLLPAYVSSALDGPVGIAMAAQVVQTLRETDRPERLELAHGLATQRLFAATIASVECELRGDQLHLPPGSGLGVEIDEDALTAHRLDVR